MRNAGLGCGITLGGLAVLAFLVALRFWVANLREQPDPQDKSLRKLLAKGFGC